ncbi:MAG: hypothetical protein KDA42_18300 [Planctomycetales bacterium]|nr:hypothetical protein [Planctomycetales bacterium]
MIQARPAIRLRGGALLVALLLSPLFGCGGADGPTRFRVEGAITYNGQPVPAGRVDFEPDKSKNNRGPVGYAKIEAGRYETLPGKGAISGPQRVKVRGFNGVANAEMPDGDVLFRPYETEVDLPAHDHSWDIDVPSSTN